jgi:hypothetical protein
MPSYRLIFDQSGHPSLEEEFCGDPPCEDGPGWTLSPGACDAAGASADRKPAAAPFQFAGEVWS